MTPQFFAAERVQAILGRVFAEEEFKVRQARVVVLSHKYWVERFGSKPEIIGSAVTVDGEQRVIVGVAPPTFQPAAGGSLWIPKRS